MATATRTPPHAWVDRANVLYWNSDHTVDSILHEMGVGHGALYGAVRPISAETDCPTCGGRMVYTNRTGRQKGSAVCMGCRARSDGAGTPPRSEVGQRIERRLREPGGWSRWREDLRQVEPERAALVGGAAALGVAVGAAATRAIRHMH